MIDYKVENFIINLVFIFILSKIASTTAIIGSCGPVFQKKCLCGVIEYDRLQQYVVNCTNAGFYDTSVLEHMPEEVAVLIFTGNVLVNLPWNIFGKINEYPNLKVIDMSNNHIRQIRGKTYHHVQQVERLILNHNNLSISSKDDDVNHLHPRIFSNFIGLRALHLTNSFADYSSPELSQDLHAIFVNSNLTQLVKLHLEQNEISHFKDPNVFCDLPQLEDLYLGDNSLRELNFNLTCLHHLRFLDLERNNFESIKQQDIDAMEKLEHLFGRSQNLIVDFNLNPFACDCTIFPVARWLEATNITVRNKDKLMCQRSIDIKERLLSMNFKKCIIRSQRHNTNTNHQVFLVFILVFFIFILLGICGGVIYINKDRLIHFMHPVMSSRKVHYTTIRDDECAQEVYV